MMNNKESLMELVRERSLKFGDFVLASGRKAKYYLDGKQVTLDARGAVLVGKGIIALLEEGTFPAAVGGMSIGADPITAAVITIAGMTGHDALKGFMVRKESKGHGTNQFIEGPVHAGDHVVVLEDVVTTGGSSLLAIDRLESAGIIVDGVIAIIYRMEGGARAFQERGITFRSLLKITDFGITPPEN